MKSKFLREATAERVLHWFRILIFEAVLDPWRDEDLVGLDLVFRELAPSRDVILICKVLEQLRSCTPFCLVQVEKGPLRENRVRVHFLPLCQLGGTFSQVPASALLFRHLG